MKKSIISKISLLATILILTTTLLFTGIPLTGAQTYDLTKETYAFVGAIPNPVGVNQEVLLHIGITEALGNQEEGWEGLTVTVEKPDGTTQTLGPFKSDSTGGTGTVFVPTMVGTYRFQTHFPEQTYTWSKMTIFHPQLFQKTVLYKASDSEITELVVQEDPLPYYQDNPLPGEFWTRPVDAQLRDWYKIAGNWLDTPPNLYAPYNEYAPETAHILWAKALTTGGIAGGITGPHAMEEGDAYEGKFQGSLVINGILYYRRYGNQIFGPLLNDAQATIAVDLRTGEELWTKEGLVFDFAQNFYFDSWNYHGVFDYLWQVQGGTWNAYDPFTGDDIWSISNVPSGTHYTGPNGEFYILETNLGNGWMALWNQTKCGLQWADLDFYDPNWAHGSWGRNINNKVSNGTLGYEWNVTIPSNLPGSVNFVLEDRVIGSNSTGYRTPNIGDIPITLWGISTETGNEGTVLFTETWQPPSGDLSVGMMAASIESGIFALAAKENGQIFAFDVDNGHEIWRTTESLPYLAQYDLLIQIAEDILFVNTQMAGEIIAIDAQTGNELWTYEAYDPYNEINWGNNWPMDTLFITDGKIYVGHQVHSPIDPKPRGAPLICLDATTGEEIFRADGLFRQTSWGGLGIIGDSIIATMDTYDQRIYAIGKGPSRLTVESPLTASAWGQKIIIRGTVTDVSPGTQTDEMKMRFPDGVPAVSDGDMSAWMRYVYKQFTPPMVSGVPVKLEVVVDPNGNWYDIGTAYTDASGFYSIEWEPPVPGHYLILASFAGSKAYYPSYKETSIIVDESLTPGSLMETEFPTTTGLDQSKTSLISTEVAIFAVIAIASIIGLAVYSITRKE